MAGIPSEITDSFDDSNETNNNVNKSFITSNSPDDSSDNGSLASSTPGSVCSSTAPNFVWETVPCNPDDFDVDIDLPCVVKFTEDSLKGKLPPGLNIYADQPVLLYKRTRRKHACARTIYRENHGAYYEVGQTLIVPEDFDGWFEVVPPHFGRVEYFRTIGEVASVMPKKIFLRTAVHGIRPKKDDEGNLKYVERFVKEGSILRVGSLFSATWRTTAETGVFKKTTTEYKHEKKYLKCKDDDGKEILVSLSTKGRFNSLYEKEKEYKNSIYNMKDLLSDFDLPMKVRLLYGKNPVNPCIFTGTLAVNDTVEIDTIIASTVVNKRNVLLDIPLNSPCQFNLASNQDEISESSMYGDAVRLCEKYGRTYSRMIKLSHEMDTDKALVQHIPSERTRDEGIKTLDLLNNISVTDDEPMTNIFAADDSDNSSRHSTGSEQLFLSGGDLMELKEISSA